MIKSKSQLCQQTCEVKVFDLVLYYDQALSCPQKEVDREGELAEIQEFFENVLLVDSSSRNTARLLYKIRKEIH